ncbi:DUF1223 domain-containing protein [Roseicitreum antarcticum]|uniref:DUF1223 domain-containing protein n=1 Tax=Roseicitreum antarcticum TaxID=564137 RepID=A0A1H2W578_9RHOB|nr:DUF1223 domain-containing protein [Roseicitreum antarcticum]SDW75740.1 hypothetical protein SAMN04488238_103272 [Roseicitreum antarcticum]
MRRMIFGLAAAGAAVLATAAAAQQQPVLVELYTSQGCSSCPPADEVMAELAGRDDVIALALHVDYWDYIGWEDSFAVPAFGERQKSYARTWHHKSVYTPQMVVNGIDQVEGFRSMRVAQLIQQHRDADRRVSISLRRGENGMLYLRLEADPPLTRGAVVDLVRYAPQRTVEIEAGENAGRTATYHNVVTQWTSVGEWDGQVAVEMAFRAEGDDLTAVVVQEREFGAVLAAARPE